MCPGVGWGGEVGGGRWVCTMQELGGNWFVSFTTHHSPRISGNLRWPDLLEFTHPLGGLHDLGEVGSSGQCVVWECICGFIWVELLVTNLPQQEENLLPAILQGQDSKPQIFMKEIECCFHFFPPSFLLRFVLKPNVSAWSSCFSYLWCTICLQLWVFSQQDPGQLTRFMLQLFFFFEEKGKCDYAVSFLWVLQSYVSVMLKENSEQKEKHPKITYLLPLFLHTQWSYSWKENTAALGKMCLKYRHISVKCSYG